MLIKIRFLDITTDDQYLKIIKYIWNVSQQFNNIQVHNNKNLKLSENAVVNSSK